jgi:hypothetical protein
LLVPSYALEVGSQRWTNQLLSLELRLEAAPLLDVLGVALPASAPVEAAPGDPVKLTLNNGEREAEVFSGEVDSVRRGLDEIRLTALDGGGKLARYRPAATYEQVTAATVVRNLCGDVGVEVGELEDGSQLPFYVADPSRTALEHVARVCAWNGALARVSADGKLETLIVNATQPELALLRGRELLAIVQETKSASVERYVVAGEAGAGDSAAPESLRPTTDFFAGSRPDGPSASHVWSFEPALRTAAAAATAGAALDRDYRASREAGSLDAWLLPDFRPGSVFEIQELPEGLNGGPFWAYQVRHRVSAIDCSTRVRFCKGGDSFDPLALLGSLAGLF